MIKFFLLTVVFILLLLTCAVTFKKTRHSQGQVKFEQKQNGQKKLSVLFKVHEESLEELAAIKQTWQRWAAYPPCRRNAEPINYEQGQADFYVDGVPGDSPFAEALKDAWDNLADRVKWCFNDLRFADSSLLKEYTFILGDKVWPVRDNWLNELSFILPKDAKNLRIEDINNLDPRFMLPVDYSVSKLKWQHPEVFLILAIPGVLQDDL